MRLSNCETITGDAIEDRPRDSGKIVVSAGIFRDILTRMKTKKSVRLFLLMATLLSCARGQDDSTNQFRSSGLYNGHAWINLVANKKLLVDEKLWFLSGFRDASLSASIAATEPTPGGGGDDKIFRKGWPASLTMREVIEALNRFYETPENRPIPITYALMLIAGRSNGSDEATIQKLVSDLRAQFH
jgi:hypothetical protein